MIFSGLLKFDERGFPTADLAEAWGISSDGTVYNLSLRNNIRWHDGEPLTTDDVLFTIDLIREGGDFVPSDLQEFWKNVDVKVLSETAIQFRLQEAYAPFLDYLAFGVLPRHLLDGYTLKEIVDFPFNLQPVGSGPYRFDRLIVENDQIIGLALTVNSDYYGQKPFLDQIVFRYYPDGPSALKAYQDGTVQGIGTISSDILNAALAEPNLSVYTGRKPQLSMVLFNLKDQQATFFQDAKVRQALLMGLNRQWIVDRILNGQAIIADSPILPGSWAYYAGVPHVEYDVEAAKTLLKDAGYVVAAEGEPVRKKGETTLSFSMLYPDTEFYKTIAESIQADWTQLNIKVELEPVSYEELVNGRLAERSYQAALVDLNMARTPDPDPYPFWDQAQATGGQNYSQWDNRSASELLEQARTTTDVNDRIRLYRNFQVIFSNETPAVLLYYPVYAYGVDRQVQGVTMGPLFDSSDRFTTIENWYLISKKQPQANVTETPPVK